MYMRRKVASVRVKVMSMHNRSLWPLSPPIQAICTNRRWYQVRVLPALYQMAMLATAPSTRSDLLQSPTHASAARSSRAGLEYALKGSLRIVLYCQVQACRHRPD